MCCVLAVLIAGAACVMCAVRVLHGGAVPVPIAMGVFAASRHAVRAVMQGQKQAGR